MADEISTTVKTTSDGMVSITVEKYHELLAQAAEKPPVIHRTVHRTNEMMAKDNVAWGATFIGVGISCVGVGALRLVVGLKQLKKLAK